MNKKVLLFLGQGFESYEASAFIDVMGWSREEGIEAVDLVTTALRPELKCNWNLIAKPEIDFSEVKIDDYDALALPGGFEGAGFFEDTYDERFQDLLREFNRQGKIIATICVAAIPVAKSGILNGRNATTWDLNEGHRRKLLAELGAIVLDEQMVVDQNIITSTGPATAIPVALKLLEMLTSEENMEVVKQNMRFKV